MRIAFLPGVKNAAVYQALKPIHDGLAARGHTTEWVLTTAHGPYLPPHPPLEGHFDIAHFGYMPFVEPWTDSEVIRTGNLWSFFENVDRDRLKEIVRRYFARVFVSEATTAQLLGQRDLLNVTFAPLVFDHAPFTPLPPPEGPFTVGVFGNYYKPGGAFGKRFEIIRAGAARAGLHFRSFAMNQYRPTYDLNPATDVYPHFHVLGHASFADTSSLPAMEALLCGRPVVAVHSAGLAAVLQDGVNGYFFDGTVEDFAEKVSLIAADYPRFRAGALETRLPSVEDTVTIYEQTFTRLLRDLEDD